jgi:hypothetical protein
MMPAALRTMTTSEIYDLLMEYTKQYTTMMNADTRGREFKECEEIILKLQAEVSERQKKRAE